MKIVPYEPNSLLLTCQKKKKRKQRVNVDYEEKPKKFPEQLKGKGNTKKRKRGREFYKWPPSNQAWGLVTTLLQGMDVPLSSWSRAQLKALSGPVFTTTTVGECLR